VISTDGTFAIRGEGHRTDLSGQEWKTSITGRIVPGSQGADAGFVASGQIIDESDRVVRQCMLRFALR